MLYLQVLAAMGVLCGFGVGVVATAIWGANLILDGPTWRERLWGLALIWLALTVGLGTVCFFGMRAEADV